MILLGSGSPMHPSNELKFPNNVPSVSWVASWVPGHVFYWALLPISCCILPDWTIPCCVVSVADPFWVYVQHISAWTPFPGYTRDVWSASDATSLSGIPTCSSPEKEKKRKHVLCTIWHSIEIGNPGYFLDQTKRKYIIWHQTNCYGSNFQQERIARLTFRALALYRHLPIRFRRWRIVFVFNYSSNP